MEELALQQGRRWDEAIQRTCFKQRAAAGEPPEIWHEIAVDREKWRSDEINFVNSAPVVPRGRFMIGESLDQDWLQRAHVVCRPDASPPQMARVVGVCYAMLCTHHII